jgi:hypothetical protein
MHRSLHTGSRHLIWEREEYNRKDQPRNRNDIHCHSYGLSHKEWTTMHSATAKENVRENWHKERKVVYGSEVLSALLDLSELNTS